MLWIGGALCAAESKNRFDPEYDAVPSGGYRDLQMLCYIKDEAGVWRFAELQVNTRRMVELKAGGGGAGGGGHQAFNEARLIDAFSERSLRYNGTLSDEVIGMVGNGVVLSIDVANSKLAPAHEAALLDALRSDECRLRGLGLSSCGMSASFAEALPAYLPASKIEALKCVVADGSGLVAAPPPSLAVAIVTGH